MRYFLLRGVAVMGNKRKEVKELGSLEYMFTFRGRVSE